MGDRKDVQMHKRNDISEINGDMGTQEQWVTKSIFRSARQKEGLTAQSSKPHKKKAIEHPQRADSLTFSYSLTHISIPRRMSKVTKMYHQSSQH